MVSTILLFILSLLVRFLNKLIQVILFFAKLTIKKPVIQRPPKITIPEHIKSTHWDYIVIGAGSGGSVVAEKLSRNPKKKVLVIESGPATLSSHPHVNKPQFWALIHRTPLNDYGFQSVPQKALDGRVMDHARGRLVGGSSAVNASMYVRGDKLDYEHWAETDNCGPKWNSKAMDQAMKRVESGSARHFVRGYQPDDSQPKQNPAVSEFLNACKILGASEKSNYNSFANSSLDGCAPTQFSIDYKTGNRVSAWTAFLQNAVKTRSNLTLLPQTTCCKLKLIPTVIPSSDPLATELGNNNFANLRVDEVFVSTDNSPQYSIHLQPKGRVIVCCGAYGTPQLLQLSGIGPKTVIESIKPTNNYRVVPQCILNIPGVGQNLQDHLLIPQVFSYLDSGIPERSTSGSSGTEGLCFARSSFAMKKTQTPENKPLATHIALTSTSSAVEPHPSGRLPKHIGSDIQLVFLDGHFLKYTLPSFVPEIVYNFFGNIGKWKKKSDRSDSYDYLASICRHLQKLNLLNNAFGVMSLLNQPASRGTVHAVSTDPLVQPRIDSNYFSDPRDLQMATDAMILSRTIADKIIANHTSIYSKNRFIAFLQRRLPKSFEVLPSFWGNLSYSQYVRSIKFPKDLKSSSTKERTILAEFIRKCAHNSWHCCGTTKMGSLTDKMTVVDAQTLLVRHTLNLHIADASVIPTITSGNINSPILAIGDICAETILLLDR